LLHRLKNNYPNVKLLFALAKIGDQNYFQKIREKIEQLQCTDQIYFLTGQKELWPLLKDADLFVRPTLSDSFGISVAEALLFGTPAIASDTCIRQKGTILFKTGDQVDFFKKVEEVLHRTSFIHQKKIVRQLNAKKTCR
jgi:glycosyltransferase involved in cell wall biosynthesis